MKKILLILLMFSIALVSYGQNTKGDYVGVKKLVYGYDDTGNTYQLIFENEDSIGQYYYRNVTNPVDSLDAVNLRTVYRILSGFTTSDSSRYYPGADGLGYLFTYKDGEVVDSFKFNDTDMRIVNDGKVEHLGTIDEHFAHISSPYISIGGDVTDNGDGTITIDSCETYIKMQNSVDAPFKAVVVPESTLTINEDENITIYIDYNAGNPIYKQKIASAGYFYTNWDEIPVFTAVNTGSQIQINDFRLSTTNGIYKNTLGQINYEPLRYLGGLGSSEVGTRFISVSAGAVLKSNDYEMISGINTSTLDTLTQVYYNGTNWVRNDTLTQITLQYNDITSGMVALSASPERWATKWLYYIENNPDYWLLLEGQTSHTTLSGAQNAGIPALTPPEISNFYAGALLVAKIIVSGNDVNFVEIQNPFTTTFQTTQATSHNNLADLQKAAAGVTWGHIDDQAQTIAGIKTFSSSPLVPTVAQTDSTTKTASTAYVRNAISELPDPTTYTDSQAVAAVANVLSDDGDVVFQYVDDPQKISATVKDSSIILPIENISELQDELDDKQGLITGAATTITTSNLSPNVVAVTSSTGKIAVQNNVSTTELSYLDGVSETLANLVRSNNSLTENQIVAVDAGNLKVKNSGYSTTDLAKISVIEGNYVKGDGTQDTEVDLGGQDLTNVGSGSFGTFPNPTQAKVLNIGIPLVDSFSGFGLVYNTADYDGISIGRRESGHVVSSLKLLTMTSSGSTKGGRLSIVNSDASASGSDEMILSLNTSPVLRLTSSNSIFNNNLTAAGTITGTAATTDAMMPTFGQVKALNISEFTNDANYVKGDGTQSIPVNLGGQNMTNIGTIDINQATTDSQGATYGQVKQTANDTADVVRVEVAAELLKYQLKSDTTDYDLTKYQATQLYSDLSHANRHESGGADEIDVSGLSGVLIDNQPTDKNLDWTGTFDGQEGPYYKQDLQDVTAEGNNTTINITTPQINTTAIKLDEDTIQGVLTVIDESKPYLVSNLKIEEMLDDASTTFYAQIGDTTGNFNVVLPDTCILTMLYVGGSGTIEIGNDTLTSSVLGSQTISGMDIYTINNLVNDTLFFSTTGLISFKIWTEIFAPSTIYSGFDSGFNLGF